MEVDRQRHASTAVPPLHILQEAGCVSEPIWTREVKLISTGVRNLKSPARGDFLYHLRHLGGQ
jgi:hypothetical protein